MIGITSYTQVLNNKTFEFPIRPNDGKWETITSIGQRLEMLQIPSNKLTEIPTSELLEICLEFPYLLDVLFSDNCQLGFECLKREFNGFNELLQRDDLLNIIIVKSKSLSNEIEAIQSHDSFDRGNFSFKWFVFEMIIAQDDMLKKMFISDVKQMADISMDNLIIKKKYPNLFSDFNTIPTYLLFAKVIERSKIDIDNETYERLEKFINDPFFLDTVLMKDIDIIMKKE